jgi:hypothetical protein
MDQVQTAAEEKILAYLSDLRARLGASLVGANEVLLALDITAEELDIAARSLELRGRLLCAPSEGPVMLLLLPAPPPDRPKLRLNLEPE